MTPTPTQRAAIAAASEFRSATLNLAIYAALVGKHPEYRDGPGGFLASLALAVEWFDAAQEEDDAARLRWLSSPLEEDPPEDVWTRPETYEESQDVQRRRET